MRLLKASVCNLHVALKEVEVFNKLNQLRSYLNLLESSISGLAETQRKHAEFWIKIVTLRIEEMDPLEKRVKYFESFDPEKQSYYDGSWHKTPMRL
jgi:hypothetical protein